MRELFMMLCSAFWEQTLGIRIVMQSENLGSDNYFWLFGATLEFFWTNMDFF